jgi:hypothetical protein
MSVYCVYPMWGPPPQRSFSSSLTGLLITFVAVVLESRCWASSLTEPAEWCECGATLRQLLLED